MKFLGQCGWVHGIACPSENVLYIADGNNLARADAAFTPGADTHDRSESLIVCQAVGPATRLLIRGGRCEQTET